MPELDKKTDDKQVPNNEPDDLTAPEVDDEIPLLDPEGTPDPQSKVHPLAPGGRRFEQVYAKGKQAEREAAELKERLAAAEAKIDLLSGKTPATEPEKEYSWAELETFIQQGRITRADAEQHREDIRVKRLKKEVKDDFVNETRQASREQVLDQTIQAYLRAAPAAIQDESPDRARLDEEFDFLASVQGVDPAKVKGAERKALQVAALRNVYGPIDALQRRSAPPKVEPTPGLPGGTQPPATPNKDQEILNNLTKPQVVHYRKMMAAGRYRGGWKEVVAEIKWQRTRPKGSR